MKGILLAAGKSERFGSRKLLHLLDGIPILIVSLRNCLGSDLQEIIVVTGHEQEKISGCISAHFRREERIRTVWNPGFEKGVIASFNRGLRELKKNEEGVMMLMGDMPFVSPSAINRLLSSWVPGRIVIPEVNGALAHPRIFPSVIFRDFLETAVLTSGKAVLESNSGLVETVLFENAEEFKDIDTLDHIFPIPRK